jgi:hypothetical protein
MYDNIVCILQMCLYPTNISSIKSSIRIKQYINGLNTFFKYNDILIKNNVDIIIVDNSISDENNIPIEILNEIPDNVNIIKHSNNNYGKYNKGSGLIENWLYCGNILKNYKWLIHFEPRQLLKNFNFINSFFQTKQNLFSLGKENNHFNTGLFCIDVNVILEYIKNINLITMVQNCISIEYDIYNFFIKNNIKYDCMEKMNLIWFDNNIERHM